jgi:hypothetical protein
LEIEVLEVEVLEVEVLEGQKKDRLSPVFILNRIIL